MVTTVDIKQLTQTTLKTNTDREVAVAIGI